MLRGRRTNSEDLGFTLLEVMVALAILGIGLVLIMQLFAGGLRSVQVSEDYTMAAIYARQKMEEAIMAEESGGATGSGAIEGTKYTWETETAPFSLEDGEAEGRYGGVEAYIVKVRVKWPGRWREKYIELSTLKAVPTKSPFQPQG